MPLQVFLLLLLLLLILLGAGQSKGSGRFLDTAIGGAGEGKLSQRFFVFLMLSEIILVVN